MSTPRCIGCLALAVLGALDARAETREEYDVVIAGGSTAALAAAFAAAEEGASVALLEPTDWIGGQLTSSGVPAVDEAWHKIETPDGAVALDVSKVARDPRNMTPFFRDALRLIGNPGDGWVSRFCFEPRELLTRSLLPREQELAGQLTVYRETVVKRVEVEGRRLTAIVAIRRTPRAGVEHGGYDRPPSQDLADWYSPTDSDRFTKETLVFEGDVFIEATEWGEVLALAEAPYLVGVDATESGEQGDDRSGQSTVFCVAQRIHDTPVVAPPVIEPVEGLGYGPYRDRDDAWQKIWTYRRLKGDGPGASPGEITLQNWGYEKASAEGGNDYPFGYLFLSRDETLKQRADWRGGVDPAVMAAAEQRALAWHDWFRHAAPEGIDPDQITLAGDVLGTGHGLAKLPYIRDTRRSIGLEGYVLKIDDLVAEFEGSRLTRPTGTVFADRVALGAYPADIHPLIGFEYPPHVLENHPTAPFYLPLRALTNDGFDNLLVAGKTMAQTFLANAATRLHPIEWSSGTAAGVIAADMAQSGGTTSDAYDDHQRLRMKVAKHTPVNWTLEAEKPATEPVVLTPRAEALHRECLVIDGHNDMPWEIRQQADSNFDKLDIARDQPTLQTDIPRLRRGGVGAQFWSVWVPMWTDRRGEALVTTLEQIDLVRGMIDRYPADFRLALTVDDILAARREGKIASLIGLEGGHCIEGSLSVLNQLHRRGARYMTLTHSDTLPWADSGTDEERHGGLTPFGESVVREMNRLGMMVDISHVSPATMKHTMRVSEAPVIFSHSSARGVADHPRNVPDDVLRMLPEDGGVVMVNFFSAFIVPEAAEINVERLRLQRELTEELDDDQDEISRRLRAWSADRPSPRGTIHHLLDHIDHIVKIAGVEHVGLGSDYDGVSILPEQLEDVSSYPYITQGLLDRGYSEDDIRAILGENLIRVFRQTEAIAEKQP